MVYSETIVALKAKGKLGADHPRDRRHRQQASASSEPNYICRLFLAGAESAFSASVAFSRTVCRSAQADPKYLKQAQDIPLMHFFDVSRVFCSDVASQKLSILLLLSSGGV